MSGAAGIARALNSGTQQFNNPNLGYNEQGRLTPVDDLGGSGGLFNAGYSGPTFAPTQQTPPSGYRPTGPTQFYQPIQQQNYQNYTTTNPLSVSQYGTPMTARSLVDSAYAGVGRYGSGNETNQVDPGGRQYWENRLASGSLNPQSLFDQFSGAVNQARQNPNDRYGQYYQNQTGYSGSDFGRGYAQQPMPQMPTPFNPYTNQYQTPFSYQQPMQQYQQPIAQRTSSGPSQAIVGRSSQMRGTPNVMRRAEGGIASLLDNDE